MTDWASTAANLATAAGTLILAGATFSSVRSAQRAARATEMALLSGIRPVLVPSSLEDPEQKVGFMDDHWIRVGGGRAVVDITDDTIYVVFSLRNVGNGLAVLDRWDLVPDRIRTEHTATDIAGFRRLTRDIYVASGDLGFWQGAIRGREDPLYRPVREAAEARQPMTVDLLYGDHEGGQRTITRFTLLPVSQNDGWMVTGSRHWNLDRPDPR